ncbi:MAG: amidase family protein, partial [Patescibacteria group bacterium]
MLNLKELTIKNAGEALRRGDFSARELVEAYIKEIKVKNPSINAYLETFDDALSAADDADSRLKKGDKSPLLGIPFAVKDNILIRGKIASGASKILSNYRASYDATAIAKLKDAGAIFLGRTNMDEFAMGSSTENSAYGPTKNPIDLSRVPGGSSGGSAAAVAMDGALAALGSDTAGSIRQPAAFCGVVGLKTTYGAVSRSGLMAMGSSLDQIGPIAKTIDDAQIIFNAISGYDPLDSTSVPETMRTAPSKKPKVLGVPRVFIEREGIDKEVIANFKETLSALESVGYELRDIDLPRLPHSLAVYYIVMPAEVSTNLARFDGVRYGARKEGETLLNSYLKTRGEGFGREARRRIMLGTYVLSSGYYDAYYGKATAARAL